MPAYTRDRKMVCIFPEASKSGARYATLGFEGAVHLDEGDLWPTSFALIRIGPDEERRIEDLLRRAVGGAFLVEPVPGEKAPPPHDHGYHPVPGSTGPDDPATESRRDDTTRVP